MHAALDSMATLTSKDEEFVQVAARKEDKTRTDFAISQYRKYSSGEITRLEYIKSLEYRFMPRMDMSVDLTKGSFGHLSRFCVMKISKTSKFSRFCMFLQ